MHESFTIWGKRPEPVAGAVSPVCHFGVFMKIRSMFSALVAAVSLAAVQAQAAVDPAVGTAITSGVTDCLAVIALGGVAVLTIKGGGVVWRVAAKFVQKLGS